MGRGNLSGESHVVFYGDLGESTHSPGSGGGASFSGGFFWFFSGYSTDQGLHAAAAQAFADARDVWPQRQDLLEPLQGSARARKRVFLFFLFLRGGVS